MTRIRDFTEGTPSIKPHLCERAISVAGPQHRSEEPERSRLCFLQSTSTRLRRFILFGPFFRRRIHHLIG